MPQQIELSDRIAERWWVDIPQRRIVIQWVRRLPNGAIYDRGEITLWETMPDAEEPPPTWLEMEKSLVVSMDDVTRAVEQAMAKSQG